MNLNKIIGISLAAFLLVGQTACLKDQSGNSDPKTGTNSVVEFQNSSIPVSYTSIYPQYNNGIKLVNDTASFRVNFNYAGPNNGAPQDIQITIAMDTAALSAFNADQEKNYVTPPTDILTYPTTVTIPKGSTSAYIIVKVTKASDWSYADAYALPLSIKSASYGIVSTNFGTAIYSFGDKNRFDGMYTYTEKLVGWGTYGIADGVSYTWPYQVQFITADPVSNTTNEPQSGAGAGLLAFTSSGGLTTFGATSPKFIFDTATNALVNVINTIAPDSRNRQLAINPAVTDSRYDPDKKIIYAAYIMTQNGRSPQYIYDTLTYKGSR